MAETLLKNRSLSLLDMALNAYERVYGLPNPIKQKSQELGRKLTSTEFIEKEEVGNPLNHYPKDKREEAYAFFVGYAGIPFATYLMNLKNIKTVNLNNIELLDKIAEAHKSGRNAAIEDDKLNLESKL